LSFGLPLEKVSAESGILRTEYCILTDDSSIHASDLLLHQLQIIKEERRHRALFDEPHSLVRYSTGPAR
jgi:hypothetical protein